MRLDHSSLLLTALLAIATIVSPVRAARLTDAQRSAQSAAEAQIRAFSLTDRFIDKFLAAQADPDYPIAALDGMIIGTDDDDDDDDDEEESQWSLDQWVDELEAKPGVRDFLAGHDLTVREFLLGRGALLSAALLYTEQQYPEVLSVGNDDDEEGNDEDDEDDEYEDEDEDEDEDDLAQLELMVSPANMSVYLRNKDKMHRTMMEVGYRRHPEWRKKVPGE